MITIAKSQGLYGIVRFAVLNMHLMWLAQRDQAEARGAARAAAVRSGSKPVNLFFN